MYKCYLVVVTTFIEWLRQYVDLVLDEEGGEEEDEGKTRGRRKRGGEGRGYG